MFCLGQADPSSYCPATERDHRWAVVDYCSNGYRRLLDASSVRRLGLSDTTPVPTWLASYFSFVALYCSSGSSSTIIAFQVNTSITYFWIMLKISTMMMMVLSAPFNPSPIMYLLLPLAILYLTPSAVTKRAHDVNTNTHRIDCTVKSPFGLVKRKCTTLD